MVKHIPLLLADEEPSWWVSMLITFFQWVVNHVCELLKPLIFYALDQVPTKWTTQAGVAINNTMYWYDTINYWVPLDWAVQALFVFLAWRIGFITVLIVTKLVRGA